MPLEGQRLARLAREALAGAPRRVEPAVLAWSEGEILLPPRHPWHVPFVGRQIAAQYPERVTARALRIGDLEIVFFPGELGSDLGARIREGLEKGAARPGPGPAAAWLVTLADDYMGYIFSKEQYRAGGRAGTHKTKTRAMVSGTGKKPWKQKGTGRARQGSIRATQWKGGGKPFGPTPRKYDKKMPTEMRRSALRDALAAKIASGEVVVVDRLGMSEAKTKTLTSRLKELGLPQGPTLLVVSERTQGLDRAARNVPWLSVETPMHASVYQVLRNDRVLFERAALLSMQEALA